MTMSKRKPATPTQREMQSSATPPLTPSTLKMREEWHRLEQEFTQYSSDIIAFFEFHEGGGGGEWSLLGAGDDLTSKALLATIEEAGNILLHSSFQVVGNDETDPRDRWITTAALLIGAPILWEGDESGVHIPKPKTA